MYRQGPVKDGSLLKTIIGTPQDGMDLNCQSQPEKESDDSSITMGSHEITPTPFLPPPRSTIKK
jgi:hypothetical protein